MLDVNDAKVQNAIQEGVDRLCKTLDPLFPGYDNGGINSDIAFSIHRLVEAKLVEHNLATDKEEM